MASSLQTAAEEAEYRPVASSFQTAAKEADYRPIASSFLTAAGEGEFPIRTNEAAHLENYSSRPVVSSPETAEEEAEFSPVGLGLLTAMSENEFQSLVQLQNHIPLDSGIVSNYYTLLAAGENFALHLNQLEQQHTGCRCADGRCSCCVDLRVPALGLYDTACLNIEYLSRNVGVKAQLAWNGKELIGEEVSLRNPPSLCVSVPGLRKALGVCVKFEDISIENNNVHICVRFTFNVLFVLRPLNMRVGCVDI